MLKAFKDRVFLCKCVERINKDVFEWDKLLIECFGNKEAQHITWKARHTEHY